MLEVMELWFGEFGAAEEARKAEPMDHPMLVALVRETREQGIRAATELLQWSDPSMLAEVLTLHVDTDDFIAFRANLTRRILDLVELGIEFPRVEDSRDRLASILPGVFPGRGLSADRARFLDVLAVLEGCARLSIDATRARRGPIPSLEPGPFRAMIWDASVPTTFRKGIFGAMETEAAMLAVGGMRATDRKSPSVAWSRELIRIFVERGQRVAALMAAVTGQPVRWIDGGEIAPPSSADLQREVQERKTRIDRLMPGTLG